MGVASGLFLLWRHWKKTPQGRPIWDRMVLNFPLVGPIVTKAALSRFARAFSLSLRSGVPMERALVAFVEGRIERKFWSPKADLDVRKLAAVEALARYGRAQPKMLGSTKSPISPDMKSAASVRSD